MDFDDSLALQVVPIIILSVWCLSKNYHQCLSLPVHFHRLSWHFISIWGVEDHTVSINMFLASTLSPRSFWLYPPFILVFHFLPLSAMQNMTWTRSLKVRLARKKTLREKNVNIISKTECWMQGSEVKQEYSSPLLCQDGDTYLFHVISCTDSILWGLFPMAMFKSYSPVLELAEKYGSINWSDLHFPFMQQKLGQYFAALTS